MFKSNTRENLAHEIKMITTAGSRNDSALVADEDTNYGNEAALIVFRRALAIARLADSGFSAIETRVDVEMTLKNQN